MVRVENTYRRLRAACWRLRGTRLAVVLCRIGGAGSAIGPGRGMPRPEGCYRRPMRDSGHMRMNARPMKRLPGTGPMTLESAESVRLSPSMK